MDDPDLKFDFDPLDIVDNDDYTIYNRDGHSQMGFQIMEDLRRKGQLCDVTLKVSTYETIKFTILGLQCIY